MKQILLVTFVLLFAFPLYAQDTVAASSMKRVQMSPEDERLRSALKNDQTVLSIGCGLFEAASPKRQFSENQLKAQRENSRVRLMLYEASRANDQTVKAKIKCSGNASDDSAYYMLVENGKIKYMGDYYQTKSGGLFLNSTYCDKLDIGILAAKEPNGVLEFTPLADKNYADKILILQCRVGARSFIF